MQRGFKEKAAVSGKGSWRARNKPGVYKKVHEGVGTNESEPL